MAGLPVRSACVSVGPPVLANGPSRGSPRRSSGPETQLPSLSRLCPSEITGPLQFAAPALLATIVLRSRTDGDPDPSAIAPPYCALVFGDRFENTRLPVSVTFVSSAVPALAMPPPLA